MTSQIKDDCFRRWSYWSALALIFSISGSQIWIGDIVGSLTRTLGIITLALWVISIASAGSLRRFSSFHLWAIAFLFWCGISMGWAVDPANAADKMQRYVQSIGITIILWDLLRNKAQIEAAFQAYVLGAYISIIDTLLSYLEGGGLAGRFAASGFNPNDLGVLVAIGVPISVYLLHYQPCRSTILRVPNLVYPLVVIVVILLTASRGSLLALLPATLYTIWQQRRLAIRWKIAFAVSLAFSLYLVAQMDISTAIQRFEGITTAAQTDRFAGRLDLWEGGKKLIIEHPFFGVGVGSFRDTVDASGGRKDVAHNLFLGVLTEEGIVGFLLFAGGLFSTLGALRGITPPLRGTLTAAFIVWVIGVCSLSWEYGPQTWLLFLFIITARYSNENRRALALKALTQKKHHRFPNRIVSPGNI